MHLWEEEVTPSHTVTALEVSWLPSDDAGLVASGCSLPESQKPGPPVNHTAPET